MRKSTKLKTGDKVLVRNDLVVPEVYGHHNFVESMKKFLGKVVTISKIGKGIEGYGDYLEFEEEEVIMGGKYWWTPEMLVKIVKRAK